ncbi:MAG: apolipoprotein N-acyltransferase, partial [Pararhodobacter sp.]|nr:apolipoprotein N-acyltransferase [Pararhodobacter sp.]
MRRARAVAPLLAAAALGALAAFGQAPWGAWYLTVPAMAAVLLLIAEAPTRGAAALRGWLAGAGQFAVALSWIVEPFLVDIATHGWMAPFALILMAGGLALFWAAAAWLGHGASSRRLRRLWLTALALLVSEALRGVLFTGFPWALVGHVWIGTPVDQIAALGGALLLSALTLGLAVALGTAWLRVRQRRFGRAGGGLVAGLAVLGSVWGWGGVVLSRPDQPARDGVIRLVQGNVPQHLKWQPDLVQGFFQRHLDLSARPRETPLTLVIWPESAAPFLLDNPGIGLDLASRAADAPLVLGLDRSARSADGVVRYFNALAHLDETGAIRAVYDKHHLVPFGEYIPLIGEAAQGWG